VNYGAHQGIEWIILTNAITWKLYRIKFGQPVNWEEVYCFDLPDVSLRSQEALEKLFMLCRESISSDALAEYHRQAQIVNRFTVAELLQSEAVVNSLRKEMRRLFDSVKVTDEELRTILVSDVIKRDALDGEGPKDAKALVKKATGALARKQAKATVAG
jgi:hypothetical protein